MPLAIATAYPPGSAIKPAQALVFLSEGIVKPDTKIAWPMTAFVDGEYKGENANPSLLTRSIWRAHWLSLCKTLWFLKSLSIYVR